LRKPEILLLTKSDLINPEKIVKIKAEAEGRGLTTLAVSISDFLSLSKLKQLINIK